MEEIKDVPVKTNQSYMRSLFGGKDQDAGTPPKLYESLSLEFHGFGVGYLSKQPSI